MLFYETTIIYEPEPEPESEPEPEPEPEIEILVYHGNEDTIGQTIDIIRVVYPEVGTVTQTSKTTISNGVEIDYEFQNTNVNELNTELLIDAIKASIENSFGISQEFVSVRFNSPNYSNFSFLRTTTSYVQTTTEPENQNQKYLYK